VDVEELDTKAEIPQGFNAEEYFSQFYGIITGDGNVAQIIKLKVRTDQAFYFRSLPLHHSQEEIETTDEYAVFKYYVVPSADFVQEILAHGDSVVVMEPLGLRDQIKTIVKKMNENYDK
jgi:predicted DNA-binding transcriptional regulator YafY